MDSLLASAGPMPDAPTKRRRGNPKTAFAHQKVERGKNKPAIDASLHSILPTTRLAPSLQDSSHKDLKPSSSLNKISDKKLRAKLASQQLSHKRAVADRKDVQEYITSAYVNDDDDDDEAESVAEEQGRWHGTGIQVDDSLGEKTWRISQQDVVQAVDVASQAKKFDLRLENIGGGGYRVDYTRNGRNLALASNHGHIASFDWQAGKLNSEIQLGETVRDIKYLHSDAFYAVAQKRYVYIYDGSGVEIHKMKQHIDVTRMEFLPYHYLLATVGNAGHLKYHDTSTGLMVAEHKTRMGAVQAMAQNKHNAIIHLGHQNGQVTLWSPNMSTPHVKLLAHLGPVHSIGIDPSSASMGRYMATSGADGKVKVWDSRNWGQTVREWSVRSSGLHELDYSMKGMLAVGGKGGVTIYRDLKRGGGSPSPYLTIPLPGLTPRQVAFCPYEDVLGVGHSAGFSSLLVPGAGEAQFDSNEADVFESYNRRREREVRGVLEKIQPDLITLDADFLGRLGEAPKAVYSDKETPYYQKPRLERLVVDGKQDEEGIGGLPSDEEENDDEAASGGVKRSQGSKQRERQKQRGKGKSLNRYLRKKRKNVVDPALVAMKEKVARQKAQREHERKVATGEVQVEAGALARFARAV